MIKSITICKEIKFIMKNKRNLLIASTTLLLSVVAIAMMLGVGSASEFTNGGYIKSNMLKASANENGDISVEVMLASGNNSVNTTVNGATLENDQIHIDTNSYAVWTNDIDSPIRGISAFYITFAQKIISFNDHPPIFYGSYNHLTFEGIQNGLYQDLKMTRLPMYSTYDQYTYNFERIDPVLTDCRYFLAVISTGEVEFNITGFEVSTPCDDEPTREDPSIGTFSNYQRDILDKIPEEATFPFIGNGSYSYTMVSWDDVGDLPSLKFLQTSENVSNFFINLGQNGYSMSYEEDNYRVYRKQIDESDLYYTFEYYYFWESSNGLTCFVFDYCGTQPSDYPD